MKIKSLLLAVLLLAAPLGVAPVEATPAPLASQEKLTKAQKKAAKKQHQAEKKAAKAAAKKAEQDRKKAEKAAEEQRKADEEAAKLQREAEKEQRELRKKIDKALMDRLELARNKAEKAEAQAVEAYQHVTRLIVRGDAASLTPGLIEEFGGRIYRTYKYFPGFAVEMPLENVEAFAQHENVAGVSEDVPTSGTAYDDIALITGAEAAAESYGTGGAGIDIAVIDSGIAQVTDLNSSLLGRVDFTMFPDSSWFDPFGHGTHVAGIIAGDGIASGGQYGGIAPRASLIDLRALDANGRGFTSDALAAVEWAIEHRNSRTLHGRYLNIRVINLSLGHAPYEPAETDPLSMICRIAVEHGIVVVAAAGNFGEVDGEPASGGITSPGIEPSVITVGAMTAWGTPSRADDFVTLSWPTFDRLIWPTPDN